MSTPERFNSANDEVYGGRRMTPIARAESIAVPRERGFEGRQVQNLVWRPGETGGVNNVQQTSFGPREALDGTLRVVGAGLDLGLTPVHGVVRITMTMVSEMEKAKKMYVGGVTTMIREWQSPLGRIGAGLMTPVIGGAWALTIAQGVVWGGLKGTYGLLKDKAESFSAHLGGPGKTYFDLASAHYRGEHA